MQILLNVLMVLATTGFALSLGSHLVALSGVSNLSKSMFAGLHIGIFVVWLPTMLVATRITRNGKRSEYWKEVLSGCPGWARKALYGLFAYAILNFIYGTFTVAGHERQGGEPPASVIRMFSGHWMVFYSAALATLYSAANRPELLTHRKCRNAHDVGPLDQFCPKCGTPLEPRGGNA